MELGLAWEMGPSEIINIYSDALLHLRQATRTKSEASDIKNKLKKRGLKNATTVYVRGQGETALNEAAKQFGVKPEKLAKYLRQKKLLQFGKENPRAVVLRSTANELSQKAVDALVIAKYAKGVSRTGMIVPTNSCVGLVEKRLKFIDGKIKELSARKFDMFVSSGDKLFDAAQIGTLENERIAIRGVMQNTLGKENAKKFLEYMQAITKRGVNYVPEEVTENKLVSKRPN